MQANRSFRERIGDLLKNCKKRFNAAQGKDAAVQSLKLLGQDRRVNLWAPDSVTGLVVLQAPQSLRPDALDLPSIEKELPESEKP